MITVDENDAMEWLRSQYKVGSYTFVGILLRMIKRLKDELNEKHLDEIRRLGT